MSMHKVELWRSAAHVNPAIREDKTACVDYVNRLMSEALEACVSQGYRAIRPPEGCWLEPDPLGINEIDREWPVFVTTIAVVGEEVTE